MRFPVVVGILYGERYMHTNIYIHRDIAARNEMVSNDCRLVKIIDFGSAKHGLRFTVSNPCQHPPKLKLFQLGATQKIPAKWLSPEVLKTWTFSTKSDTWAFGVCIWEIYHNGAEPAS
ncbi:hypothetical protein CRE_13609 [Caenorhabditis remanei]|uniref:Protein kinase domain-containing protein n=1 Tax=Caenorhabditis remanei TaxID=31234 RepID=E3N188_CAERE|nr:hypothetical protein CRE_13609 [Caenorhabditis remanei]